MTITMVEAVGSQSAVIDMGNTQLTIKYNVSGSSDREAVISHVVANIPGYQTVNGLALQHKKVSNIANKGSSSDCWVCTVVYNHVTYKGDLPTGQVEYLLQEPWDHDESFSISSESEETLMAHEQRAISVDGVPSKDVGLNVRVDYKGRQQHGGLTRTIATGVLTKVIILPPSLISPTFMSNNWKRLGHVNDKLWAGYKAGNLLFDGLTGDRREDGFWIMTYTWKYRPGEYPVIPLNDDAGTVWKGEDANPKEWKEGWEYLWQMTRDRLDGAPAVANTIKPQTVGIYIAKMYPSISFDFFTDEIFKKGGP